MTYEDITEQISDDAIRYVRANKTWTDAEEDAARERMYEERCSLQHANYRIADEIDNLLQQFTEENDMPEEWWLDWFDVDGIIEYSEEGYL